MTRVLGLYLPDTLGRTSLSDLTVRALTDHYAVLVERGGRRGRPLRSDIHSYTADEVTDTARRAWPVTPSVSTASIGSDHNQNPQPNSIRHR